MGVNYYLLRKIQYDSNTPAELGCGDGHDIVVELTNGLVWNNKYYKNIKELNKEFYQKIHIGKSSCGWHYNLCIYPKYEINNLNDWKNLFKDHHNIIVDECNNRISTREMLEIITKRSAYNWDPNKSDRENEMASLLHENEISQAFGDSRVYQTYDEVLRVNHACRGKNGLWAHQEDRYITHTDGPYDYIISGNDPEDCRIFS